MCHIAWAHAASAKNFGLLLASVPHLGIEIVPDPVEITAGHVTTGGPKKQANNRGENDALQ